MDHFKWSITESLIYGFVSIVNHGCADSCIRMLKGGTIELPTCCHLWERDWITSSRLVKGDDYTEADSGLSQSEIGWIRRTLFEF